MIFFIERIDTYHILISLTNRGSDIEVVEETFYILCERSKTKAGYVRHSDSLKN